MNDLQRRAMAREPMRPETVEELERLVVVDGRVTQSSLIRLCESHERLRAELKGAEILLIEAAQLAKGAEAMLVDDAAVWEIMQRRKWWPYYSPSDGGWRINWDYRLVIDGLPPWPWWDYESLTGMQATWHDPRAAIITADKWYREYKE